MTLRHVFDWRMYQFRSFEGWMVVTANILNVVPTAFAMRVVLGRARQCLDFAATVYLVHAIAVWLYAGFPASIPFWVGSVASVGIISALAEWLLMRKELEEIPLAALRPNRNGTSGTGNSTGAAATSSSAAEGAGMRQSVQLTQR